MQRFIILCTILFANAACMQVVPKAAALSGNVLDANGKSIGSATVSVVAMNLSVSTNSQGAYAFSSLGSTTGSIAVTAGAPGYARQTKVVDMSQSSTLNFSMRAADLVTTITLGARTAADRALRQAGVAHAKSYITSGAWQMTDTGTSWTATTVTSYGGMGLTIPEMGMITSSGAPATGDANLSVTYWQPGDTLDDAPGSMNAIFNGNPIALNTFGMTDIQVTQGSEQLQIAQGNYIQTTFLLSGSLQGYMQQVAVNSPFYPSMWYEDESSGLWTQQGIAAQGNLTYDSSTGVITANLPHLSGWNIDGVLGPNGCVAGTAVDPKGNPVQNQNFNLWLISTNETETQYFSAATDASGKFCVNVSGVEAGTNLNGAQPGTNGLDVTAPMFASYGDPKVSSCNPLPIQTVSQCVAEPDHCVGNGVAPEVSASLNGCTLPTSQISVCHYCAGQPFPACYYAVGATNPGTPVEGGCNNIGNIQLPGANAAATIACFNATVAEYEGRACASDADCCPPGGGLVCLDSLCVPAQ